MSVQIQTDKQYYLKSITYQEFLNEYSFSFLDVSEINYQKEMVDFENEFLESKVGETSFLVAITDQSNSDTSKSTISHARKIVDSFVTSWNKENNLNWIKRKSLNSKQAKLLESVNAVEKTRVEIVSSTPFDLTYQDQLTLEEMKTEIRELIKIIQSENYSLENLVEAKVK